MESILNAGLGVGILMFLLLVFKKERKTEDFLFLGWISTTLLQILFYLITIYHFELKGFWAILNFGLPLLGAPLLFLYILSLTGHKISWKVLATHLGIYLGYVLIFFILSLKDNVVLSATNGFIKPSENSPAWMQYYAVPLAISGFVYCTWDLILLNKHNTTILDYFSFEEKVNLKWVRYIVNSYFILFFVASFLIFGAIQFQLLPIEQAFTLVGICLSIMLIAFGFYGFRQTSIFTNLELKSMKLPNSKTTESETATYSKSGLTEDKIKVLAEKISRCMLHEKYYLNENLSLSILSEQCNLSEAHLSQIINQNFQKHFYDFVNQYRVEEVKKKTVFFRF